MKRWLLPLLLAPLAPLGGLACSDTVVVKVDNPPAVAIVSPTSGSSFFEDYPIALRAEVHVEGVTSPDYETMTHSWVAGDEVLCESAPVEATGEANCTAIFDAAGEYNVTVSVSTADGQRAEDTISLLILTNGAPTITITSPADGDTFNSGELVVFEATLADAEDPLDQLVVAASSNLDGDLADLDATPDSSGVWTDATTLSSGDHLVTFTVTDTGGKVGQDSLTLRVNDPPGAPGVSITPTTPVTGEAVTANIVTPSTDPENDPVTYTYAWYVDGSLYSKGSVPGVPAGVTFRDEFWEVYVYPSDGFGTGPAGQAAVAIANAPPAITSVSIVPSPADTTADLTCTPQNWADAESDPPRYLYAWEVNGAIDGAETTDTFPAAKTTRGDAIRCEATPVDDYDAGTPLWSPTLTIDNALPTAPGVAIEPSVAERDDDLNCLVVTPSTDADGDPITYLYSWLQNGVLTGVTTSIVDASLTADGDTWECRVTPDDGVDLGPYGSASVTIVDVTAPPGPYLDPLDPYRNEDEVTVTGTCEPGCDLDFTIQELLGTTVTTTFSEFDTCDASGTLSHTTLLTRGYTTTFQATCTDAAGNVSAPSNLVSTEACSVEDIWENITGYGDDGTSPIDEWAALTDDGSTVISIQANALDTSDEDWYVIETVDDLAADEAAWEDRYNFEVRLVAGSGTYSFLVFQDDPTTMMCPSSSSGYTEFSFYNEDQGDGGHAVPANPQSCRADQETLNACTDYTTTWYVQVFRNATASPSCEHYELEITNGVW